uniref:Rhophilin-2-like n=1 Tax=Sinocyclocheilus grahami TaxID=75366 RepID=A0A672QVF0_SINGR
HTAGLSEERPADLTKERIGLGCNPFAQTGRSKLQNKRARLNQQIIKQMRMRAGAENLLKATSNNKVREQVALELSYVNSDLQLLMEQLEGLNSSVDVYQNVQETSSIPLIPLGLKETKDVDFSVALKDFILEHYSEDGSNFQVEIDDLMDLRQACRTPSRNPSGVDLLASYFSQLSFLEPRFFSPTCQIGIFFTWYDSFTGVPVCQQNISLEKASILFNMAALCSQIGTRTDRQTQAGLEDAIAAFQKSAGVLHYLKETFTHTPSYDMSPAMLSMLIRLMVAQAQECMFEQITLPGIRNEFFSLLKIAQEAAKVGETYSEVHQSMIQTPIKNNVPFFWTTMSELKTNHYNSLAHYFVSTALLDHHLTPSDDEDKQEKALSQLYDTMPEGRSPLDILKDKEERRRIGKAHLQRSIMGHEEAIRTHSRCRHLQKLDILSDILQAGLKRALTKFEQNDKEDEFTDYMLAPDIISKTEKKAEMEIPAATKVKVKDLFQRLVCGLLILLKDILSSFHSTGMLLQICRFLSTPNSFTLHLSILLQFRSSIAKSLITSPLFLFLQPTKSATYGGLPKTYSMICLAHDEDDKNPKSRKVAKKPSFLSWGLKNKQKSSSTLSLPNADYNGPWNRPCPTYPNSYNESALY